MADDPSAGIGHGWLIDTAARDAILAEYEVASARDEGLFDDLASFLAALFAAPVALVSVMHDTEQRFLARIGTDLDTSPRATSFCTHAMTGEEVMVVPDATRDPRFATNPLVTEAPHLRFYAGVPLRSGEGVAVGAVCVFDLVPRDGITPLQRQGLEIVGRAAQARLDDRRAARARDATAETTSRRLADSEERFRTLADTMPQMVWSTLPDGYHDYYNARWYEFTGALAGTTDGEGWNGMFHPADQDRAWAVWRHSLTTGEPYQIEYRLRHFDGTYRWVLGRALPIRDADGAITRWFGTCTDIHEQKLALEEREVVSQELAHRIKNIFAVVSGLISLAARSRPEFKAVAADLRERITALGRAHDFVRPHSAASRPAARQDSLAGLLGELFAAYRTDDADRLTIHGDEVAIDDRSTTPLALLFHELATNATKYGALSVPDGRIDVETRRSDGEVVITWSEHGGPPVAAPMATTGFGSQLIELSAVRQLGGGVERDWRPEGLIMTIRIPASALVRA